MSPPWPSKHAGQPAREKEKVCQHRSPCSRKIRATNVGPRPARDGKPSSHYECETTDAAPLGARGGGGPPSRRSSGARARTVAGRWGGGSQRAPRCCAARPTAAETACRDKTTRHAPVYARAAKRHRPAPRPVLAPAGACQPRGRRPGPGPNAGPIARVRQVEHIRMAPSQPAAARTLLKL